MDPMTLTIMAIVGIGAYFWYEQSSARAANNVPGGKVVPSPPHNPPPPGPPPIPIPTPGGPPTVAGQIDLSTVAGVQTLVNALVPFLSLPLPGSTWTAPLTVDGIYGDSTTAAVEDLQKFFGVTMDGKFGPATRSAVMASFGSAAGLPFTLVNGDSQAVLQSGNVSV